MIPSTTENTFASNSTEARSFGLSVKDSAHIMGILRSNIYSDAILAVIREYSANAWDANRSAGRGDRPIRVTIPTSADPEFVVADHGPGLSHDEVFNIFTQYGSSTKRETNEAVGMLGIGSKSGFAYCDSFLVKSAHGGELRTYCAALDDSGAGTMSLLSVEPCDYTGVTVKIDVKKSDINAFQTKAVQFYANFEPRPVFGGIDPKHLEIASKAVFQSDVGTIYDRSEYYCSPRHVFSVSIGCVTYPIDSYQLETWTQKMRSEFGRDSTINLKMDIGAVDISASRESLQYTSRTKKAIGDRLAELLALVEIHVEKETASCQTEWTKAIACMEFSHLLSRYDQSGIKTLKAIGFEIETAISNEVSVKEKIQLQRRVCSMARWTAVTEYNVRLVPDYKILIHKRQSRALTGYDEGLFGVAGVLIQPQNISDQAFDKAVSGWLLLNGIDGVPVVRLTAADWHGKKVARKANKMWLVNFPSYDPINKNCFEPIEDTSDLGDFYCYVGNTSDLDNDDRRIMLLAQLSGMTSTLVVAKKPVDGALPYDREAIEDQIQKAHKAKPEVLTDVLFGLEIQSAYQGGYISPKLTKVKQALGDNHPLTKLAKYQSIKTSANYQMVRGAFEQILGQVPELEFQNVLDSYGFTWLNEAFDDKGIERVQALDFYRKHHPKQQEES